MGWKKEKEKEKEAKAPTAVPTAAELHGDNGAVEIDLEVDADDVDVEVAATTDLAEDVEAPMPGEREATVLDEPETILDTPAPIDVLAPTHDPIDERPSDSEVRPLHERIRTLGIQLDTARAREDDLTSQVVKLEGSIDDARSQARELETRLAELGSLRSEVEQMTQALDLERARSSEHVATRRVLEEEANRLSSQVAQLTGLIDEAKADATAEATRAGEAEARIAEQRERHERFSREQEQARDQAQAAAQRLQDRLDGSIQELVEAREVAARDLEAARQALTEHGARITEAEQASAAADARAAEAESRVTQVEARATQAEQAATSAGIELSAARAALDNLEGAHETLKTRANELRSEVERQAENARVLQEEIEGKRATEGETERLSAELVRVRADLEAATADGAAATSRIDAVEAERAEATAKVAELEASIDDLRRDAIHKETAELDELRAQLTEYRGELDRATTDLVAAHSAAKAAEKELEDVRGTQVPSLRDATEALRVERDEARNEIEQMLLRTAELESSAADAPAGQVADADSEALHAAVADLELRLEQAEMRARRAYSAAEAAEAALAYEKERRTGMAPAGEAETEANALRQRMAELLDRVAVAEEGARKAQAELADVRASVQPRDPGDQSASGTSSEGPSADDDETTPSLRTRLAGAASSRKGSGTNTDRW